VVEVNERLRPFKGDFEDAAAYPEGRLYTGVN
jgi:hypothetical protein